MKTQWPTFGCIPIAVDDSQVNADFTYDTLVNSGADVIVISDPAGAPGCGGYSQAEIDAVARYASLGHTVLGTFLVFAYETCDNRGLAPIFGLPFDTSYTLVSVSNVFRKDRAKQCLFTGIPGRTWMSSGYAQSQVPATAGKWPVRQLSKVSVIADTDDFTGIISTYNAGAYTAIYISNFPEYFGGTLDKQLLYNAVTCYSGR